MPSDAFIQCRVTPEMKEAIRFLAQKERTSESALIKQLLSVILLVSNSSTLPEANFSSELARDFRISVRLNREDRQLLVERSSSRGIPCATYISVLVRSHLRKVTPLPKDELLALRRVTSELGALGRNVNQLARTANQSGSATTANEYFSATLQVVIALRDHVKALLIANERSWEDGYAAPPN